MNNKPNKVVASYCVYCKQSTTVINRYCLECESFQPIYTPEQETSDAIPYHTDKPNISTNTDELKRNP